MPILDDDENKNPDPFDSDNIEIQEENRHLAQGFLSNIQSAFGNIISRRTGSLRGPRMRGDFLPDYFIIDLIMIPLTILLIVYIVKNHDILFYAVYVFIADVLDILGVVLLGVVIVFVMIYMFTGGRHRGRW